MLWPMAQEPSIDPFLLCGVIYETTQEVSEDKQNRARIRSSYVYILQEGNVVEKSIDRIDKDVDHPITKIGRPAALILWYITILLVQFASDITRETAIDLL